MAIEASLLGDIGSNLTINGQREKIADSIASNVATTEDKLIKLYSAPDAEELKKSGMTESEWLKKNGFDGDKFKTIEGAQQAMNIRYQRAQRMMQAFTTLIKNAFDLMMELIRNMRTS